LLHTSLHSALDRQPPSWKLDGETVYIPDPADIPCADLGNGGKAKANGSGGRINNGNGLSSSVASLDDEVTEDDEVTLRFYLTSSYPSDGVRTQLSHIATGTSLFLDHKKWNKIDTFLVGWRHVNYIGQPPGPAEDGMARSGGCGSMKLASKLVADAERLMGGSEEDWLDEQKKEEMKQLWQQLPSVLPIDVDLVGTMSLPLPLLEFLTDCSSPLSSNAPTPTRSMSPSDVDPSTSSTFEDPKAEQSASASVNDISSSSPAHATIQDRQLLADLPSTHRPSVHGPAHAHRVHSVGSGHTSRAPAVNRLNTPDCHSLPQELLQFANERKIQLWAGGSGEGSGECSLFHYRCAPYARERGLWEGFANASIMMRFTNK